MQEQIKITGIVIKDNISGNFTSYFAEFPEAIAEGKDEKEAISNLFKAFNSLLKFKKEEANNDESFNVENVTTKSFSLQVK